MLKKIKKFVSDPKTNYPNIYIFSYHVLKAIHKFFIKTGIIKQKYLNKDTFDWSLYNLHYKGELIEERKRFTTDLSAGDYQLNGSKLIKVNSKIKPLHPSHRFLYETILQLNPASVFEMGCGTGKHLYNLQTLAPKITLSGIDLSPKQIATLHRTYPFLNATIKIADATVPLPENFLPQADLAFTQAVIMHIHTDNLHLIALANLFKIAQKYVVLMESERTHHYMENIKKLQAERKINWENIYYYNRLDPETKVPLSIICSKEKLSDDFVQLN